MTGSVLPVAGHAASTAEVCGRKEIGEVARYFSTKTPDAAQHFRSAYQRFSATKLAPGNTVIELPEGQPLPPVSFSLKGQSASQEDYFASRKVSGFLVIKDGEIREETYRLGADRSSVFLINSMSKSVVSLLVGIAVDQGMIDDIDQPITEYLPELKESGFQGASIRDLLNMSTAVYFKGQSPDAAGEGRDIRPAAGASFACGASLRPYPGTALKKKGVEHGEKWEYINTNTQVLTMLVEKASGMTAAEFAETNLWSKIGAKSPAYWLTDQAKDAEPIEQGWMGMNARLRDLGRLGLMLTHDGKVAEMQVISPQWLSDSFSPDNAALETLEKQPLFGYSHQWWLPAGNGEEIMGVGFGGQYLYVNPAENLVIVMTSVSPEYGMSSKADALALFRAVSTRLQ
ncbi:hypothetical protein A3754_09045 [Alcanivorax sp. HI0083]|uniref:serine hydrolase domain-containing protein n=1 Tax=unclassified Alcanivorax TaxID=2638842 RepID=UPI0007C364D9|nr:MULTISPECIES: serine hydrolase [unclassified Alcanivorax]KZY37080.1 hypothetical protein A3730_12030 [Alcanivorax sp. HI0044]KZZ27029.1 hypothetical protein A3754_09045 [Alcanivorax sp. HI0083]